MTDPSEEKPDLIGRATDEVKAMGKEGLSHPSAKPILTGAAVGAVAGLLLPVLSVPIGVIGGAGYMLWRRIQR